MQSWILVMPGHAHGGVITHTGVHPRRVGKYRSGHVALLGVVAGPAAGPRSGPGAAGRGPLAGRRALRARLRTKKRYVIETSRYYMAAARNRGGAPPGEPKWRGGGNPCWPPSAVPRVWLWMEGWPRAIALSLSIVDT